MPIQLSFATRTLRIHPFMTFLTALAVIGFGLLGRWQWHRADEKRVQQSAFAAGSTGQITLGRQSLATLPRFVQVDVTGQYDVAHQFLLDNISRDGRAGYEVLTPLQTADGRTLLVNRGWLPLRDGQRALLPDVSFDSSHTAPVSLRARVDELPEAGLATGRAPPQSGELWPKLTSFPTTAELSAALGRAVETRQLLLAADQKDGYRRDWQPPNSGFWPERHISYAIQWWSLGLLAVVLYFVVSLKRH